jgi:hypothetical protein
MRSIGATTRLIGSVMFLSLVGWVSQAHAQLAVGTWVRTDAQGKGMTMTVAACCNGGSRLTYNLPVAAGRPAIVMTVESPMNGTEVPALVGGKPSGETMAITRVDERHYRAVVKMGGQVSGTSDGTISADGKSLTVETVSQATGGTKAEKVIETWVRK